MTSKPSDVPLGTIALVTLACAMTATAVWGFFAFGGNDFRLFLIEGLAFVRGEPLYRTDNLNTPSFTALVFGPLARLPYPAAQVVWLLAGVLALLISFRLVVTTLLLDRASAIRVFALLLLFRGAFMTFSLGQVGWFVLLPGTLAWIAFRRGRLATAGIWLGAMIAVKPTFVLTALLLPAPVWMMAGVVSVGLTILGIIVTGWPAWTAWMESGSAVAWVGHFCNPSLWGLAARLEIGGQRVALTALSGPVLAAIGAVGGWCAWVTLRTKDPDRRFTLAVLFHALFSPLGWIYYLLPATGSAIASWPRRLSATLAFLLLCLPIDLFGTERPWGPLFLATVGSIFAGGVLMAFASWMSPEGLPRGPRATGGRQDINPSSATVSR